MLVCWENELIILRHKIKSCTILPPLNNAAHTATHTYRNLSAVAVKSHVKSLKFNSI